ncbi:MAG TPA: S8 family serine peptidase [Polyangia bacterium]|nr:S8 family serine peptidase [Polyangia bacterium]
MAVSVLACGSDPSADVVAQSVAAVAASPAASTHSFLISFTGGGIPANADSLVASAGGAIAARYGNAGAVLARSTNPAFATTLRGLTGIDAVGDVASVQSRLAPPTGRSGHRPSGNPPCKNGDPLSSRQWDMDQIHAPQARAITTGKKTVRVGLFDSGIDVTHPDLIGQVDGNASATCIGGVADPTPANWQNDFFGHGTHVAGTIAALQNGIGIVGVAPGVKLSVVKILDDNGMILPDAMLCGLDWAMGHGWDLINASLTVDPPTGPDDSIFCSDQPDRAAIVAILRKAFLAAANQNISVIAAAGNFFLDLAALEGSTPGSTCKVLPVQLPHVIGVSAVGYTRQLSSYSDYGLSAIDLTGPGGDYLIPDPAVGTGIETGQVLSSAPAGSYFYQLAAGWNGQVQDCSGKTCATYMYLQGTSQAAPHVTGVAALIESRYGRLPPDLLLAKLSLSATPLACPQGPYDPGATGQPATCVGPPFYNSFYGAGEVDALAAVR